MTTLSLCSSLLFIYEWVEEFRGEANYLPPANRGEEKLIKAKSSLQSKFSIAAHALLHP